jgi:hypothetical protein
MIDYQIQKFTLKRIVPQHEQFLFIPFILSIMYFFVRAQAILSISKYYLSEPLQNPFSDELENTSNKKIDACYP